MDNDTPLTNEADDVTMRYSSRHERVRDLARTLERELTRLRSELEAAKERIAYGVEIIDAQEQQNERLREAAQLVLLFYRADWAAARLAWDKITGGKEATTKVLCDHIRAALAADQQSVSSSLDMFQTQ